MLPAGSVVADRSTRRGKLPWRLRATRRRYACELLLVNEPRRTAGDASHLRAARRAGAETDAHAATGACRGPGGNAVEHGVEVSVAELRLERQLATRVLCQVENPGRR